MMNSAKRALQMTLGLLLPVAVILGVVPIHAQGPQPTQPSSGPTTLFLPFVTRAYSPPTSFELIEKALARGEIDEETALSYKVFAVYLDPRLPGRFKGDDSKVRDTLIAAEVATRWPSLSPATQALLTPFLLPPAAPGSWLEFQHQQALMAGPAAPVEWVTLSRPGGEVKVWYQTRYPGDDVLAAKILNDLEDIVWQALTDLMGRGPLGDGGLPNNGGDDLFDVYIVRIGNDGEAHPYPGGCDHRPAFMLVNGATPVVPATIVHEFMHAITLGYDVVGCEYPEYRWLSEATATWSEDFISPKYDTAQDEQGYAPALLNHSEYSLDMLGAQHEYGAYLWPFYLARTYQPELIRTIWDATATKDSREAVDGAIPGGFLERWPEFAKLNLNREPVDEYNQWDGLTPGARFYSFYRGSIPSGSESEIPLKADVQSLAALYHRITPFDSAVTQVRYENGDRFFSGAEPRAKVEALIKIEGQPWTSEDWTRLPDREFCRTKPEERVEELVIIISNSEWEDRGDLLDPGSPAPLLRLKNEPCSCEELAEVQNWTGQVEFSFTTSASSGDESISIDHSATVDLLMVPDYENDAYVGWQDASLSGTGEVNDILINSPSEDTIGSGDQYPGGPGQDDPGANFGLMRDTCTFQFYLKTGMSAQHTIHWVTGDETYPISTWVGLMDINDIPAGELTGSRTVPAVYWPTDEPSWYVPGSSFDGDLEWMIGYDFGEATVSWSFAPAN